MGLFSSIKDNLHNAYQVIAREQETGAYPIWRHPTEDFRNGSILQVNEDDVALILDNGKILESFTGGRYSLTTSNYPFLDRLRAAFSGGENSYKYTVFYISKRPMTNLMWGTQEPMEILMPMPLPIPGGDQNVVPIQLQVGANYTAVITNPKTFLLKDMEGTTAVSRTQDELNKRVIRPMITQTVKQNIAKAIMSAPGGIYSIQMQTESIANELEGALNDKFAEYGMHLNHFYVDTLNVVDSEEWREFKKARAAFGTRQMEKATEALGEKQQLDILGNNWQRIQARDIMKTMAQNPGAGGVAATGAGLGMGMVAGGVLGSMAASMFAPMQEAIPQQPVTPPAGPSRFAPKPPSAPFAPASSPQALCPHCGEPSGGGKFCGNCGQPLPQKRACPSCGSDVPTGCKFCPECGTKMG